MPSRLTGFVCPTVSMVTTGHATGVEKTIADVRDPLMALVPVLWFRSKPLGYSYSIS